MKQAKNKVTKKLKSIIKETCDFIKEEYKFILVVIILYMILMTPLNGYILTGGGISDISSRIQIEKEYDIKGSYNIAYVTEIESRVYSYLLSYIIPDWKIIDLSDYIYDETETQDDVDTRSYLDLDNANSNAIYYAYTLANKDIVVTDTHIIVTIADSKYDSNLQIGDEIVSINDKSYDNIYDYKEYFSSLTEDDELKIKIIRNNKEKVIKSHLTKVEDQYILGVVLDIVRDYKTDPEIKINFKSDESGPSGGLITTLYIYDRLTKKDLTHGYDIAGSGTIESDGSIGQIGEVKYKLLGAVKKKADIFLAAGQNYKDCIKLKKEKNLDIKIIEVNTIEDAIEKLENLK